MSGYAKLFSTIIASTIWREDNATRIVWITMLAMRNRQHVVEASLPGLAHRARVKLEDTEKAVRKFLAPDKFSRSCEHDGRRIEKVDGGWRILNGDKYRRKLSEDDRREYQRIKQAEYRALKKGLPLAGEEAGVKALEEGNEKGFDSAVTASLPDSCKA